MSLKSKLWEHYLEPDPIWTYLEELEETMTKKEVYETEEFKNLSAFLLHHQIKHERVGSSLIQGVSPGGYDILVMENDPGAVYEYLTKKGWAEGGSKVPDSEFISYRWCRYPYLAINVILTDKEDFYNKFSQSNAICVEAQLKKKYDRIKVYDYMFNRNTKPTDDEFSRLVRGESLGEPENIWSALFR